MSTTDQKLAIVLNGGGARGSYQAGVLRALYEIIKKDQNLFNIITGNSAGAINASYLASSARDWGSSTQYLVDLWKRVKPEDVYDISQYTMTKLGSRWVKGTIFRSSGTEDPINGILNTDPLRTLLEREIDFKEIRQHISENLVSAVAVSTTNYFSGASVVFFDCNFSTQESAKSYRFAVKTELNVDHIMGSSAIPLFFPPSKIGESYYGDGCIRQITPLSPAIDLGATKIITIGIRNQQPVSLMKEISFKANKSPQISQVAGIMMDAIFLDSLESDVERLKKVNTITEMMGNKSPWRNIPILSLSPSRDLGLMTEKLSSEMPLMLRYFLRSIGVTGQSGLDLLSYLAFDSSYTTRVTELGYEDTMAKKKEILNFIDS